MGIRAMSSRMANKIPIVIHMGVRLWELEAVGTTASSEKFKPGVCLLTTGGTFPGTEQNDSGTSSMLWTPFSIRLTLSNRKRNLHSSVHTGAPQGTRRGTRPFKQGQVTNDVRAPPVVQSDGCQQHTCSRVGEGQLEACLSDRAQAQSQSALKGPGRRASLQALVFLHSPEEEERGVYGFHLTQHILAGVLDPLGAVASGGLWVLLNIPVPCYCIAGLAAVLFYVEHTELLAREMGADLVKFTVFIIVFIIGYMQPVILRSSTIFSFDRDFRDHTSSTIFSFDRDFRDHTSTIFSFDRDFRDHTSSTIFSFDGTSEITRESNDVEPSFVSDAAAAPSSPSTGTSEITLWGSPGQITPPHVQTAHIGARQQQTGQHGHPAQPVRGNEVPAAVFHLLCQKALLFSLSSHLLVSTQPPMCPALLSPLNIQGHREGGSEPQLWPVGMVLEGSSEALCPPPSLELRPSCNKSQPSPPLGSSSTPHDGVFPEDKEPVKHNGSLANGDKGRRRSRLALYKRPKANGVKPDVIHNVSTPLVSKRSFGGSVDLQTPGGIPRKGLMETGTQGYALSNKSQHSISYTLSRSHSVIVEYTHDTNTDMFQISPDFYFGGRMWQIHKLYFPFAYMPDGAFGFGGVLPF
ncbi:hypothetical protein F7725_004204 [Dissostichus mawsoni]|uniref:Pellino FHA domain-containing protein n=1 Tax=Dissostichus mawsoni TaxID=36200 RepID=A0A7J5XID5_DISMA|nr:hypothetical protein F7725_004204 [Dissostichus mawsoni]